MKRIIIPCERHLHRTLLEPVGSFAQTHEKVSQAVSAMFKTVPKNNWGFILIPGESKRRCEYSGVSGPRWFAWSNDSHYLPRTRHASGKLGAASR